MNDRLVPKDTIWRRVGTVVLDSSGNGSVKFETNPGYEFFLHRLYITDGVGTFGSPTTGGYITISTGGAIEDGFNLGTIGLPVTYSAGSSAAIVVVGGERLAVTFNGCAANRSCTVVVRGRKIRSHSGADEP